MAIHVHSSTLFDMQILRIVNSPFPFRFHPDHLLNLDHNLLVVERRSSLNEDLRKTWLSFFYHNSTSNPVITAPSPRLDPFLNQTFFHPWRNYDTHR